MSTASSPSSTCSSPKGLCLKNERTTLCASLSQRQIVTLRRDPVLGIGLNYLEYWFAPQTQGSRSGPAVSRLSRDMESSRCELSGPFVLRRTPCHRDADNGAFPSERVTRILDGKDENSHRWHPSNAGLGSPIRRRRGRQAETWPQLLRASASN
jgi:hypothetical protein